MKIFYKTLFNCYFKKTAFLFIVFFNCYVASFATVYNVTDVTDGTATNQLRGAIAAAATTAGPHTINVAAGTYILSSTTFNSSVSITSSALSFGFVANQNITIIGAGAATTIIQMATGANQDRIMYIGDGVTTGVTVSISGITFKNGNLKTDTYGGGAIIAGGPTNSLTINNCAFVSNTTSLSNGSGGAIAFTGGGTLSISNTSFTSNTTSANGGAIDIEDYSSGSIYPNASISITDCIFTNNSAPGANTGGGAIFISAEGNLPSYPTTTLSVNILRNTFNGNAVSNAVGSYGGAIAITNSFNNSNTFNVNYNRFVNNTCGTTSGGSALYMTDEIGNVDATNNWWSCNTGATACSQKAVRVTGSLAGTLTTTPYLFLTETAGTTLLCTNINPGSTTLTASFLTNSATATIATSNLTALIGVPISFTGGASGTISAAQTTIQNTGTATATFTATATAGTGGTATVDGVTTSAPVTVAAASLPTTTTTITQNTGVNNNVYQSGCAVLATVIPDGSGTQVSGSVTAKVWVESTLPHVGTKPFLARHYQITPATNATTATGSVTLYFLQSEFNAFNADAGATLKLPTGPSDATGIANFKLAKYSGISSDGSGLPSTYPPSGTAVVLTPTSVIWNTTLSRWEVTVAVNGFSGFIAQTSTTVLAINLTSFTANLNNNNAQLNWQIAKPEDGNTYNLQRSINGIDFVTINTQQSNNSKMQFNYTNALATNGNYYYRLQMIDFTGKITYSNVLLIKYGNNDAAIMVYPNPIQKGNNLSISLQNITANKIEISNLAGQIFYSYQGVITGSSQLALPTTIPSGMYFIKINTANNFIIQKIIIQ